jgi:alpha-tubulin suppressor-like RCC1 family protein
MKTRHLFFMIAVMLFTVMAAATSMPLHAEAATRPRGKTADTPTFGINGGAGFMAILKADGSLWSSGYNAYGQLGNGTQTMNGSPLQAGTNNDWTTLSVGGDHTAGIKADGTLWTWGANHTGQLGIGTAEFTRVNPTQITSAGTNWRSVAAGGANETAHTIALRADGTVWAWGDNSSGQLGDGTTTQRRAPVQVTTLGSGNVAIAAGANHSLAIKADGTLWAWGSNANGQLGIGNTSNAYTPTQVGVTILENFETSNLPKLPWVNGGDAAWTISPSVTIGTYTYYPASGLYMAKAPVITANQNASKQLTLNCQAGTISFWYSVGSETNYDGLKFYIDGVQKNFWTGTIGWTQASYPITAGTHTFSWEYHKDGSVDVAPDTAVVDYITISPVNLHSWVSVSAGTDHTVAINADGTVWAWGNNGFGQLGDGTTTQKTSPVRIAGAGSDVANIAAGSGHTLAIKHSGELWGWGASGVGQLGCGGSCGSTLAPQRIGSSNEWLAVAAGQGSSLGAMSDGTVWAWGLNNYGQLGDGTITTRTVPVKILWKGDFWREVGGGSSHSAALKSDGTLWTWGGNADGQLGDKSNQDKHMPQKIGDNRWAGLGIGRHSMAVKSDGTLWGWGNGTIGQLGNGVTASKNYPVVVGGSPWSSVAAGTFHSAGLKADGSLWTWGNNGNGQLGCGAGCGATNAPQQLLAGTTWLSVAIGDFHTAAVKSDGTLWAWGYNGNGNLGDGTTTQSSIPVAITAAGDNWLAVSAGYLHTVALKSDGTLWSWGYNGYGQLGLGNTTQQTTPQQIQPGSSWKVVSAGYYHTAALRSDGTLWAWGNNSSGQLGIGNTTQQTTPQQIGTDANWVSVSAGDSHTLAVKADGTLWVWGYNGYGQIGDWSTVNKNVPTWIDPQYTWLSVAAGVSHTLATKADGSLWGWGHNSSGELGDGTITDSPIPKRIGYSSDWLAVAAGWTYSVGLKSDGTLWSWGYGYYGNLGSGTPFNELSPQQIGTDTWKTFTVGWLHTLGIKSDGTLWAWGQNGGKLGDGGAAIQYVPVAIAPGTTWTAIAAGNNHTLGIKEDGTLWAWGDNSYSQLGCGGGCLAPTNVPQQIGSASNWVSVAAGANHSIGITSDGKLYGWGDNSLGQSGLGSGTVATTPAQIGAGTGWVAVASKDNHTLAVDSGGRLYAWGDNSSGQLGNGGNSTTYTPTQVGTDSFWTGIFAAGNGHSVAANKNGMLYAWGSNNYGQVGDGVSYSRNTATRITTALNVTLSGLGSGTVTAQALSCAGRSCSGSYEYGSNVVLTAAADSNSSFTSWLGCTSVAGTICTANLTQLSTTVYALFNDTSKPTGSISIAADYTSGITKYTKNTTLSLTMAASDPVGVAQMQFSEDGSTWTTAEAYSTAKQYVIATPVDKTYTIWARFIDAAGNSSVATINSSIILKRTGPGSGTISITPSFINGGNKYTKVSPVTLTLAATDSTGVAAMQFCNEVPATAGACNGSNSVWSSPESYATTKSWAIPTDDGSKTIYVRFRDNVGNWSSTANDTIIFDSSLPGGSIAINDNAPFTTSPTVTLALTCTDSAIGCSQMQFSNNGLGWNSPEAFSTQRSNYILGSGPSSVFGWGYNLYGQLGIGTAGDQNQPRQSGTGSDWSALSAGGNHTLAVRSDGTLWAWGRNESCQLGLGTVVSCNDTTGYRSVPTQVGGDADWAAVAAGDSHSLALKADGSLWAWGNNALGQLGIANWDNQNTPQPVASGSTWRSIGAGSSHSLAIKSDGSLWAWGDGTYGQLGTGSSGAGVKANTPQAVAVGSSWNRISCGAYFNLAIKSDNSLWAWGNNSLGQLGTGNTTQQAIPQPVAAGTTWSSVAAGGAHSLAIKADSSLWSWGSNSDGQLGCGSSCASTLLPQNVVAGILWSSIASGYYHSSGIRQDGSLWTWGYNYFGQLGTGNSTSQPTPQQVSTGTIFSTVTAGCSGFHTAAIPISDTRYVFARIKNNLGTWSSALMDSIVLDENTPNGGIVINSGAPYTNSASLNLTLTCTDPTSGCADMCISNGATCSAWEKFSTTKNNWSVPTGDGAKTVSAWFRDAAGNQTPPSQQFQRTITLDQSGPSGSVSVTTATPGFIASPNVALTLTCNDGTGGSGCAQMQFSNNSSTWTTPPVAFSTSAVWNLNDTGYGGTSTDGDKSVYIRLIDSVGNPSTIQSVAVKLDSVAPTGSLTFNSITSYTTQPTVTLNPVCIDTNCSMMQFSNDGSHWSALTAYPANPGWDLTSATYGGTPGDGTKTVFVQFQDKAGRWSSDVIKKSVLLDRNAPTGSIVIQGGASHTKTTSVDLTLTCNDGANGSGCAQMCISNQNPVSTPCTAWIASSGSYPGWLLPPNDGTKSVYVLFRDAAGIETPAATAYAGSISLDQTGPTGSVSVNTPTPGFIASPNVTLTLTCGDGTGGSGCAQMQFSNNGSTWTTPPAPFATSAVWNLNDTGYGGTTSDSDKTVYVRLIDNVGNPTAVQSVAVRLDSLAPTGSLTFNGLSTNYTTAQSVTLNPVCIDANCSMMQFSNDGSHWSTPVAYPATPSWDLTNSAYGGTTDDGDKTVFVQFQDKAGRWSTDVIKRSVTLDRAAPSGSIVINNSAANTTSATVTLTLSCTDAASGCDTMEFKNESGAWSTPEPFGSSKVWPLSSNNGTKTVSVRFADKAGRTSTYSSGIYLDDTPPTTTATPPGPPGVKQTSAISVTLACNDNGGSGCAATYYTLDGGVATLYTGSPIAVSGITTPVVMTYYSTDLLGNRESPSRTETYVFEPGVTTLTLDTPPTLLQSGLLDVSGKLTRYPDSLEVPNNGMNLSGLSVSLTITGPAGSQCATPCTMPTVATYTSLGHYKFTSINTFNYPGVYTIKAHFAGTGLHQAADSTTESLLVGASAGYAIIVEGKVNSNEGLTSHNKTTNRVYATLKERGFEDDNIMYFNYGFGIVPGVDATPSKADIQYAIESWARDRMNGAPAPLYIVFVDHGNNNTFYIYPDTITPTELNNWLNTMEASLSPAAKLQKRIIILGACYSGSFLDTLKQAPSAGNPGPDPPASDPNTGRIVIASAASNEQSYKGPNEPDGIRSGEFFIEELFKQLKKGSSLKTAFSEAATQTRAFTSQGGGSSNAANGYNDNSVQHPLLDDDGDGLGSNTLVDNMGDGIESAGIHLGIGVTNASLGPADIKSVTETLYLDKDTTQANLRAEAYSNAAVSSAWFEVKSPTTTLSGIPGQTGQLDLDLPRWTMTLTGDTWQSVYGSNSAKPNEKFGPSGKYEVFYFTKSKNAEISEMRRSVVYKNYSGNTPPAGFDLLAPPESVDPEHPTKVRTNFNMVWSASSDDDGLTYTVQIATDAVFNSTSIVFQKEEIENSWYYVDETAGLTDGTTYYWRIIAVDRFGAQTLSAHQWSFTTDNTNAIPGQIKGYVKDALNAPVSGAAVTATLNGNIVAQTSSGAGGAFVFVVPPGGYSLNAAAAGYTAGSSGPFTLASGGVQNINITVIMANPTLQITLTGSGSGTVSSDSGGIACLNGSPANCSAPYTNGTLVTLTATPDWKSLFGGWSGCSAIEALTGNCQVSMNANRTVAGSFTPNLQVRVNGADYASLQAAYDNLATSEGSIIMAREHTFLEPNLLFNTNKTVTIDGGYNSGYSATTGVTTIDGTLTVRQGTLKVKRLAIK